MAPIPINDALFLLAETREQPMHVGGLELFRLPEAAGPDWLRELYEEMIHAPEVAPLFELRPYRSATSMGAWTWQTDLDIDLEYHIRHSALPRPGRVRELLALVSRLHGTLLDRHRPLWEAHLIEGLEGDRFAVYTKFHHALMDGVSSLRLLEHALAGDPDARHVPMPWSKQPERERRDNRAGPNLLGIPKATLRATTEVAGLGPYAGRAALRGLLRQSSSLPSSPPKTILNGPITGARRYAAQSWPLARVRAVAKATGTTINDVVLAMSSASLRQYLDGLGALPDVPFVAMTPVSLRSAGADIGGNAVGVLLCNLATHLADPGARLEAIQASMNEGKKTLRSMTPIQVTLTSAIALAPMIFSLMPGARRLASPPYNVVISNVPGPSQPLYWNGARLEGVYPLSILTDGQALNITVTSYHDNLHFGLTGCRSTVPHLQRMLDYLEQGLVELEKVAGG